MKSERISGTVRPEVPLLAVAFIALALACSSGLEGDDGAKGAQSRAQPAESTNLRFGFDPCLALTDPITDFDVAGGVLPTTTGSRERPVAFFTFVTKTPADDADGMGTPLDPDAPADTNLAADVFVAVVDIDSVDPRSFVYAIAGKMRHTRCVTCHQMNIDVVADPTDIPPTAFATQIHTGGQPPLNDLEQDNCVGCHIDDWLAPAANFDLRGNRATQLFGRAQIPPEGLSVHFSTDPRVIWALDGEVSPFGNAPDDDHDGVDEPEDHDGIIRGIPGGSAGFLTRLQAWMDTADPVSGDLKFSSADDAVQDIVLASRDFTDTRAGNGSSFTPSTAYAENVFFISGVSDPTVVPFGFLHVAFASDATDMVGGTDNGVTDIFRSTIAVHLDVDGEIDLRYDLTELNAPILVSNAFAFGGGNGPSTAPDIAGDGQRIAYVSLATDIVSAFEDGNGATEPDVYLWDYNFVLSNSLVSHVPGKTSSGGDGGAYHPDVSHDGNAVAFESVATDLIIGDTNGLQDVFYAVYPTLDVMRASVADDGSEGTGGDSRHGSIFAFGGGNDVRVAFESDKTDLVFEYPAMSTTNVFLRDSRAGGSTLLLNQVAGLEGGRMAAATDTTGAPASADAFHPAMSPYGNAVMFETVAENLDFVRPDDENRLMDVVMVDLLQFESLGLILPYSLSVTADGGRANGLSHTPQFSAFTPPTDAFPLGLGVFATEATNLGNSDPGDLDGDGFPEYDNHMMLFLREGASVVADFEADPSKQGMGLGVKFENRSSGNPTTFLWDFGDTTPTSTEPNPMHVYAAPGDYTVTLDVTGDLGTDTRRRMEYIRVLGAVDAAFTTTKDISTAPAQSIVSNVPDTAIVAGAIDDNDAGSILLLDVTSSNSTECPDTFEWTLVQVDGLGFPIGPPMIVSTEADPEDIPIDAVGLYDLTLNASGLGGAGQTTQRIAVYQKVDAVFTTSPSTPQGPAALAVQFNDASTGDLLDATPHFWNFDDGGTSTLASPLHNFAAGVYSVTLNVKGKGGDQDTSLPVTVTSFGDLTAAFSGSPNTAGKINGINSEAIDFGAGVSVAYSNTSARIPAAPLFYRWSFGTGPTGMEADATPTVLYSLSNPENVQTFFVNLVASINDPAPVDCTGLMASECDQVFGSVKLYTNPSVNFSFGSSFSSPSTAPPHRVSFGRIVTGDGSGTSPIYRWYRSNAGGSTANILFSTSSFPTYEFSGPGIYKVKLDVEVNGPGGSRRTVSSSTKSVTVKAATFKQFYDQAIAPNCISCHGSSGNLSWSGSYEDVRDRLVNVNSFCNSSIKRIVPNNVNASLVWSKISENPPDCSGYMGGNLPSSTRQNHRDTLASWINGGALATFTD